MDSNSAPTVHCGISDETPPHRFIAFFFHVCINGANRNYQILCCSLKPSYGNHYLTMLRQDSKMTSASFNGFAGGSKCKALLQRLCESSVPLHNNALLCGDCTAAMQNGNMRTPAYQDDLKPNRSLNEAI